MNKNFKNILALGSTLSLLILCAQPVLADETNSQQAKLSSSEQDVVAPNLQKNKDNLQQGLNRLHDYLEKGRTKIANLASLPDGDNDDKAKLLTNFDNDLNELNQFQNDITTADDKATLKNIATQIHTL